MKRQKPLIALTTSYSEEEKQIYLRIYYERVIKEAGGIPFILPLEAEKEDYLSLLSLVDGVLFTGGGDIYPFLFGEEGLKGCGNVNFYRDELEIWLFQQCFDLNKAVLGICRGLQMMNVAMGGSIYQDISSEYSRKIQIAHQQPFDFSLAVHSVNLQKDSQLATLLGQNRIRVNSVHHQGIKALADAFYGTAYALDGLCEAIEAKEKNFILGVQWHPERMYKKDKNSLLLFQAFIHACEKIK
ncbi:peptidase C26 [Clostridia bacterium]|nr:peptidase C26 [Clostridia bacterium]